MGIASRYQVSRRPFRAGDAHNRDSKLPFRTHRLRQISHNASATSCCQTTSRKHAKTRFRHTVCIARRESLAATVPSGLSGDEYAPQTFIRQQDDACTVRKKLPQAVSLDVRKADCALFRAGLKCLHEYHSGLCDAYRRFPAGSAAAAGSSACAQYSGCH